MSGYAIRARRPNGPWSVVARFNDERRAMMLAMMLANEATGGVEIDLLPTEIAEGE